MPIEQRKLGQLEMLGIYEPLYLSQPHELPISTTRYALSRSVPLNTLWTFTRI